MATMNDVARVANVSIATVSHVINGTRFVSPERVAAVQIAMRELGYTPDATARSLRVGRTDTIGLVVPDNSNPFFATLARWIEEAGFEAGYTTILANSNERPDREHRYVSTLVSKRVDGLILSPSRGDHGTLARLLENARIPVVVVDRDAALPGADVVLYDNEGGSYEATRYLIELGHTCIGCVAGPADASSATDRVSGFRRAIAESGLDDQLVVEADFHFSGGREATARLLDSGAGVTAVFASNDLMAAGAIRELAARGISVPGDVSVVGFDDAPLAEMISPALTTMRQPLQDMAHTAVSMLLSRVTTGDGGPPVRKVLPTSLVIRDSTAPPRSA
jgi:LacI family transcriptional regulator, galactose operon repressor